METSDKVIIAGYGFRDEPVNRAIRQGLTRNARVLVVNPEKEIEAGARAALDMKEMDPRLSTISKPLPGGLDLVA